MISRLLLLAVLAVELAACRPIPSPGPPTVTRMVPQPTGCAGTSGACSHHGGVRHG